jgi:hypothetical protein
VFYFRVDPPHLGHFAVRVGDVLVDLTARQYDHSLPYPLYVDAKNPTI